MTMRTSRLSVIFNLRQAYDGRSHRQARHKAARYTDADASVAILSPIHMSA